MDPVSVQSRTAEPAVLLVVYLTLDMPSVTVKFGAIAHCGDAVGHDTTYTVAFWLSSRETMEASGVPETVLKGIHSDRTPVPGAKEICCAAANPTREMAGTRKASMLKIGRAHV